MSARVLSLSVDGLIFYVDEVSGSVLIIDALGRPFPFTSGTEVENLTGEAPALGPLDEIVFGNKEGEVMVGDSATGLLLRLGITGDPNIHVTEAEITQVTGGATASIQLPRFLINEQVIGQDIITGNILRFGIGTPVVQPWTGALELTLAAGGPPAIASWTRGGSSNTFYARFFASNNVVNLGPTGIPTRYLQGTSLEQLFPHIANLRVLDIVSDTLTDILLLLIGDGTRGVALVVVDVQPTEAKIFTSEDDFEDVLGAGYDISDIGILADGVPFAIDRAGVRVLTFNDGTPVIMAESDSIARETGAAIPEISSGIELGAIGVVVPEKTTGNIVLVDF